ncbi:hypothetical protein SLOPH_585 [Spraguea lophii 42_110]|uniref:UBX domain-containing protein n=1 Tax=Spraguea lophii (strain 42_110) TaxID=1358809 RepID=S7XL70_SPRLO|nr:hypothetical protein SLOPH_585 [Spraguea lophii 42_110]
MAVQGNNDIQKESNDKLLERRNKEREDELKHLRRIKAQIEDDKREREKVFSKLIEQEKTAVVEPVNDVNMCKVKIRNITEQNTFRIIIDKNKKIADLYKEIEKHLGRSSFTLSSFQAGMELKNCKDMGLMELGLYPNGTIILK